MQSLIRQLDIWKLCDIFSSIFLIQRHHAILTLKTVTLTFFGYKRSISKLMHDVLQDINFIKEIFCHGIFSPIKL